MLKILLVDDERIVLESFELILKDNGFDVSCVTSGEKALAILETKEFDLIISDLTMPGMSGLELTEKLKDKVPDVLLILMTGFSSVETAVKAMKLGAYDYIEKPFKPETLLDIIKGVESRRKIWGQDIKFGDGKRKAFKNIIGHTKKINKLFGEVKSLAETDVSVLITGENGTGKELVADAIHSESMRSKKSHIKINCAAMAEGIIESELFGHEKGSFTGAVSRQKGIFEMADGGTLFLDEIGELPPSIQVKLLRVLETSEFKRVGGTEICRSDFRLICATNRDLEKKIKRKEFREDLYYRINTTTLSLPPLRERANDIPFIAEHLMSKVCKKHKKKKKKIANEAMALLMKYKWPGNVRELKNVIERTSIYCSGDVVRVADLPDKIKPSKQSDSNDIEKIRPLAKIEASYICDALSGCRWNIKQAASRLDISRSTLYKKMEKYDIKKPANFQ